MKSDDLKPLFEPILGAAWQTRLAAGLGRNTRTIRRQVAGEIAVQGDIIAIGELLALLQARGLPLPQRWASPAPGKGRRPNR